MSNRFVIVDLETTGNTPKKGDRIIQFAACVVEDGKIVEEFSSLINPEKSIPPFIEELTGLTDEMVGTAPLFSEIAPKVMNLLEGAYFVAHNVLFDLSFLQEELIQAGYEGFYGSVLDTVEMARVLYPTADSYKLNELAMQEGLKHERPHQADSDAYVTAELFIRLYDKFHSLPLVALRRLLHLSEGLKSDISLLLDELVLEKEGQVENCPDSIEIYRGLALRKIADEDRMIDDNGECFFPERDEEKEAFFLKAFSNYEKRSGQFVMMDAVFAAFSEKSHVLIEAGTGVGKSLAYLLPSVVFAKKNDETVVISTYTLQLQEQLLTKDIPLLQKMVPFQIKTSLLKGRHNYISLAKFEQTLKEEDDNYDTTLTKMQIIVWLTETKTGDVDELNLSSGGMLFWNKTKNEKMIYLEQKPWASYDFYKRARKKAEAADVIITNHALLLTDLASDNSILPKFHYCVIDEGHHFEKGAACHFGDSLDYLGTRILLSQFGQYEHKQYFYELEGIIKDKVSMSDPEYVQAFEINQLFTELIVEMDDFYKAVRIYAKKKSRKTSANRVTCRIRPGEESTEWSGVVVSGERFSFLIKDLISYVENSLTMLKKWESTFTLRQKKILEDISLFLSELEKLRENLIKIIIRPSDSMVAWIEIDVRSVQNMTKIYAQPMSVSGILREQLFNKKHSVVITSATLSVKNSFQYIISELGLTGLDYHVKQIESPFNYKEHVQLVIPNDLPEVNNVPLEEYVSAISEHIISIAEATKGRMMVLFTSYEMLRKTYDLIKESGLLEEYVIIGQGITGGSRTRLTRNFQKFDKAILLGTSSFWEGVDIPGEDLSCLVIVRLPFSPPNEPLTEAKCDVIRSSGGNPFSEYALPEAIIRFKQGFGRLIRTSSDRGIVIVFDRRLTTTAYGKAFLQSVPPIPVTTASISEIINLIHNWL